MPSTRDVARQLIINLMTVSKAYKQLEMDGYLVRQKVGFASQTYTSYQCSDTHHASANARGGSSHDDIFIV